MTGAAMGRIRQGSSAFAPALAAGLGGALTGPALAGELSFTVTVGISARGARAAANSAFGGTDGRTLYMTARSGLYRIRTSNPGIRPELSGA